MSCGNKTRAKLGQDVTLVVYKIDFCKFVNFRSYKMEWTMRSGKVFLDPECQKTEPECVQARFESKGRNPAQLLKFVFVRTLGTSMEIGLISARIFRPFQGTTP